MKKMTTSALVLATASLFSMGAAFADDKPAKAEGMIKCEGANACKGQGECGTAKNSCASKNECKGHGWNKMTTKECAAKGGKEMK